MKKVDVLVIGAGFSGLGAVIRLTEAGYDDIVVLERGNDVGGTWRDNTYPGAACDVPSHLYSYSFAHNPEWSRSFSAQPEIQDYIKRTAREHDAYRFMRFGVEVTESTYDVDRGRWTVKSTGGDYDARIVILGVGPLCEPKLPDIEGIESFSGEVFHSARWDHETDLSGKRVAVIGTGASAIQIVPSIADKVGHMDVYQRTAPWIIPRNDREYTTVERLAARHVPGWTRAVRGMQWMFREAQVPAFTKRGLAALPAKTLANTLINAQVRDPELREKVTPKYEIGCKRILISNHWYPTLQQDNVELVTDGIQKVTPNSIVTADGTEREIDVLIIATGFRVTDSPAFEKVYGAEGASLGETWRETGMSAYKGATVPGFPNMFLLIGPATGLGHSSMIYMIESQLNYLVGAMDAMRERQAQVIDVRDHVHEAYNAELRDTLSSTVWKAGGCSSWYLDEHGNAPAVWPSWTFEFRNLTKHFDMPAYYSGSAAEVASATGTGVATSASANGSGPGRNGNSPDHAESVDGVGVSR